MPLVVLLLFFRKFAVDWIGFSCCRSMFRSIAPPAHMGGFCGDGGFSLVPSPQKEKKMQQCPSFICVFVSPLLFHSLRKKGCVGTSFSGKMCFICQQQKKSERGNQGVESDFNRPARLVVVRTYTRVLVLFRSCVRQANFAIIIRDI